MTVVEGEGMARKVRIDMAGTRYGRLFGAAFSHAGADGHAHWLFRCDCGAEVVADGANVRAGSTTSCGCLHREVSAARLLTHGRRAGKCHDATYRAWQAMNDGCVNPASPGYAGSGGCGIDVAAAWRTDFAAFLADMGERPDGKILARRDRALDYAPGNCIWTPASSRSARAREGWRRRTAMPGSSYATA